MAENQKDKVSQDIEDNGQEQKPSGQTGTKPSEVEELKKSLSELNDKYVRLYADFENYKKLAARNKEELIKYSNETLMSDFLTVIDHLELALQHSQGNKASSPLAEGVELTLKELKTILEKHGLVNIDAMGKPFDPNVHHALSQIESEEKDENTVVTEFRKGYMLRDRVLRAALVGVSKKPSQSESESQQQEEKTD